MQCQVLLQDVKQLFGQLKRPANQGPGSIPHPTLGEGDSGPEVTVQWAPTGFPREVSLEPCASPVLGGEIKAGRGGTNVDRGLGGEAGGHQAVCSVLEGLVQLWVHSAI